MHVAARVVLRAIRFANDQGACLMRGVVSDVHWW